MLTHRWRGDEEEDEISAKREQRKLIVNRDNDEFMKENNNGDVVALMKNAYHCPDRVYYHKR